MQKKHNIVRDCASPSIQVSITLMKNASAFDSILVTKSDQKPHDVIEVRESKQVTISLGTVRRTHEYLWTECKKKKKIIVFIIFVFMIIFVATGVVIINFMSS